ncbi:MAG: hypothetical protein KGJ62_01535 [Armatimonadetes bacterium]|nr:hypothetical protein [Armatimonadota bacterium]MDE2205462.1 hypothetical protein [Armatimonadota bacterium]
MDFLRSAILSAIGTIVTLLVYLGEGVLMGAIGIVVGRQNPTAHLNPSMELALAAVAFVMGISVASTFSGPPIMLMPRLRQHLELGEYVLRLVVAYAIGIAATIGLYIVRRNLPTHSEFGDYMFPRDDTLGILVFTAACGIVTGYLSSVFVRHESSGGSRREHKPQKVMSGVVESDYASRRREAYRNLGGTQPGPAAPRGPAPSDRTAQGRKTPWIAMAVIGVLGIAILAAGRSLIRKGNDVPAAVVKKASEPQSSPTASPVSDQAFEDISPHQVPDLIHDTASQVSALPEPYRTEIASRIALIAYKIGNARLAIDCAAIGSGRGRDATLHTLAEELAFVDDRLGATDLLKQFNVSGFTLLSPPYILARNGKLNDATLASVGIPKDESALSIALGQVYRGDYTEAKRTLMDRSGSTDAVAEAWLRLFVAYSLPPYEVPTALDEAGKAIADLPTSEADRNPLLKALAELQMKSGKTDLALFTLPLSLIDKSDSSDGTKQLDDETDDLLMGVAMMQARTWKFADAKATVRRMKRRIVQAEALARIASFQVEWGSRFDARETLSKANELLSSVSGALLDSDEWNREISPDHDAFRANWFVAWANYRIGDRDETRKDVDLAVRSYEDLSSKNAGAQPLSDTDKATYARLLAHVWYLDLATTKQSDAAEVNDSLFDRLFGASFHLSSYNPPIVVRPHLPPYRRKHELQ